MAGCGKCNKTPRGSDIDALIEKIKCEVKNNDEIVNLKKLCIQASNKSRECIESNGTIDSKISDLECLIKKLQDELNELSCASKPIHGCKQGCEQEYECDPCKPVVNEFTDERPLCSEEPIVCTQFNKEEVCQSGEKTVSDMLDEKTINSKDKIKKSSSHRFPIILRDIGHVKEQENKSKEILESNKLPIKNFNEDVSDVENKLCDLENDNEDFKKEDKPIADTDSIAVMIAELRAEISETIHTLNKDNIDPSNSQ